MGQLTDFYEGESKNFSVEISVDGVAQNITADTISFILKKNKSDDDLDAYINENADVLTGGASGIAYFEISATDTVIEPDNYYYEIRWSLAGGGNRLADTGHINILERVFDA